MTFTVHSGGMQFNDGGVAGANNDQGTEQGGIPNHAAAAAIPGLIILLRLGRGPGASGFAVVSHGSRKKKTSRN